MTQHPKTALPSLSGHRARCQALVGLAAVVAALHTGTAAAQANPSPADATAAPAEPTFDILEYQVEGNTVLPNETVERAVYPHLGLGLRADDVEAARKALENAYRSAGFGFATVDIPEQRVDGGVIRLQVTEGRIARTRVTGARYYSQGYILERVSAAAEGQVPHLPTIQAQLLEVNRSSDRRVTPLLRPGREAGTTEVDLAVEDQLPVNGSVSLNNQASRNTSSLRLQAAASYDNLFQRDHSLALQAVVSPQKTSEVRVISGVYSVPMGAAGLETLAFTATRSDSEVSINLGATRLLGKGSIFGVRRSLLLNLSENDFQLLTLGVEYKDMLDTAQVGDLPGVPTPITFMPLSAAWTGAFKRDGADWQLGATLSGGLRGLVNQQRDFSDKRYQAQATYALLRLDARHTRTLPWLGLRLRGQVEAQLSAEPLISNEQFVVGGAGSVRGYLESEAVGDTGLRGSLQLSSPDLAARLGSKWLSALSVHTFLDAAVADLHQPLPGQDRRFRLMGTGFGLQAAGGTVRFPASLSLDLAWPLLKRGLLGSDGMRLHASATVGF